MPGQAFRTVTADELAAIWPRATLVDVRGQEEHAAAYIPGSLNIPLDDLTSRLADLPNGTIYVLCGSRKRSSQAARILTDRGYTTVNVAGGITEWYRAGHPVTYRQSLEQRSRQGKGHLSASLPGLFRKWSRRKYS
ncbi:rhodanese-like domain-containing protein [Paenarthrobacter nicotinovorans]|uniref:rhodanese-like domain-containing protein n=1 Tax=Paenarthrobacter nicotinovorans TaxID=29320 RepID=UPI003D59EC00